MLFIKHPGSLAVVVTLLLSRATVTFGTTCTRLTSPEVLSTVAGMTLTRQNYATLEVGQLIQCGIRCMRQRKCKSINYSAMERTCVLNMEDHTTAPGHFISAGDTDRTYFNVDQWDQRLLGSCREHSCQSETICVSHAHGFAPGEPRYACVDVLDSDVMVPCDYVNSCTDCTPTRRIQGRWFDPVGCYHSGQSNVLPYKVANLRDQIDWNIGHLDTIINACAELSSVHDLFGLEFYSECYAGNFSQFNVGDGDVGIHDCPDLCGSGTGAANVMFVYRWRY